MLCTPTTTTPILAVGLPPKFETHREQGSKIIQTVSIQHFHLRSDTSHRIDNVVL